MSGAARERELRWPVFQKVWEEHDRHRWTGAAGNRRPTSVPREPVTIDPGTEVHEA
ncbi:hypothetical protein [Streptomyces sp. S.PB5]|uniref:hypothetical protein n=1 Tax=Streptomyces sp. S.PB5 TaxID=3020844 RepID=UPI0025B20052|nr:hypothetical protein [Streptomyces sp. S.PB5]MDN3027109.1 hypothetical protein [Streptomyces sp. S.PB5]